MFSHKSGSRRFLSQPALLNKLDGAVTETHYHYDQADQLVAETDSTGKVIKEYIYHAQQQIALVDYDAEHPR